jgi:hypothetical protein
MYKPSSCSYKMNSLDKSFRNLYTSTQITEQTKEPKGLYILAHSRIANLFVCIVAFLCVLEGDLHAYDYAGQEEYCEQQCC